LDYERNYYLVKFPSTYASKFKETGFNNFYHLVKQDLMNEIEDLVSQKIKLLAMIE
jgi:hypothetical protein